jgi:hypothetical protein
MQPINDWLVANWYVAAITVVYIVVNFAPRQHPDQASGLAKAFWLILDRVSILTAKGVPGKLKWIFAPSPQDGEPDPPPPR